MTRHATLLAASALALMAPMVAVAGPYDAMIASHAAANGVPVELVHRVIVRESRYNPHAVHAGNYGMMQIRLQTARGLGYTGTAQGLLDPNTNLTYAVKYLAGAYKAAGGNHARAVSYYASGYYYAAKRQGIRTQGAATPTFAAFSTPERPTRAARGRAVAMAPVMMSDVGVPQQPVLRGSSQSNRALRAARRAEARQAATGSISLFKDNARPRSAKASANPFAALFKPEPPRRRTRG